MIASLVAKRLAQAGSLAIKTGICLQGKTRVEGASGIKASGIFGADREIINKLRKELSSRNLLPGEVLSSGRKSRSGSGRHVRGIAVENAAILR